MTYSVRVDDNYHYMDSTERYTHGTFETWEEALTAARGIVDGYLASAYTPGMSAEKLYQSYTNFGDDPFIIGPGNAHFSAWDYARARCAVLCSAQDSN
jgi:hypothetical protein